MEGIRYSFPAERCGNANCSDRLAFYSTSGAGDSARSHGEVCADNPGCSFGHLTHNGQTDGSVRGKVIAADIKHIGFDFIAIGDYTALVRFRRAGDLSDGAGYIAAGAAFGRGECHSAPDGLFQQNLGYGEIFFGDGISGSQFF